MTFSRNVHAPGNPSTAIVNRLIACILAANLCYLTGCTNNSDEDDQIENTLFLLDLPANRWIKYHHLKDGRMVAQGACWNGLQFQQR